MSNSLEAPAEAGRRRLGRTSALARLALIGVVLAAVAGAFAYFGGWFTPGALTPARFTDGFELGAVYNLPQLWHSLGTEAGTDNSINYWTQDNGVWTYASHLLSPPATANAVIHGDVQRRPFGSGTVFHLPWDRSDLAFRLAGNVASTHSLERAGELDREVPELRRYRACAIGRIRCLAAPVAGTAVARTP